MAEKRRAQQTTISNRRTGTVDGVTDALVGAPIEWLAKRGLIPMSERDAAQYRGDVVQRIGQTTGLPAMEQAVRNVFGGHGTARDYVTAGIGALPFVGRATPVVRRAAQAVDEALLGQRVANRVVPAPNPTAKASILEGRALTSPSQVTYAQRNISTAELGDALKRGRFNPPPKGSKHSETPAKWWSAADEKGVFGRTWAKGDHTVRVPAKFVSASRAVQAKYAEVFDPATKSWLPLREYGKKYAIGGVVVDDGNPAKQRKLI